MINIELFGGSRDGAAVKVTKEMFDSGIVKVHDPATGTKDKPEIENLIYVRVPGTKRFQYQGKVE